MHWRHYMVRVYPSLYPRCSHRQPWNHPKQIKLDCPKASMGNSVGCPHWAVIDMPPIRWDAEMLPSQRCHRFRPVIQPSLMINLTCRLIPFPCCTATGISKIICHTASQPFIYTPCSMQGPNAIQCNAVPCHASLAVVTFTPVNEKSQPHENKVQS